MGFSRQEYWSGLPFPSPMHESEREVAQSCQILSGHMDCSLPGSTIHGIFQARVLEWGVITFSAGLMTSWQIEGEIMETMRDFIFLDSKITADSGCNHEIKRSLLLRRKAMTNLNSILKSRDITLPTKVPYSQGYGFSSSHV